MLRCAIRWKCNKKRSRFGGLGPSRRPLCRGRTWEIALSPRVIVDKSYHLCERQIKKKLSLEERGDRGEIIEKVLAVLMMLAFYTTLAAPHIHAVSVALQ